MRQTIYVAAPYGADTPARIQWNIERATFVARALCRAGWAPLLPHAIGAAGVYGCPNESDGGETRKAAIECSVALAAACSWLFVLLHDDGTASKGCAAEERAWLNDIGFEYAPERECIRCTWADLGETMVRTDDYDDFAAWSRLCEDAYDQWLRDYERDQ